jgi:hypothetical protein
MDDAAITEYLMKLYHFMNGESHKCPACGQELRAEQVRQVSRSVYVECCGRLYQGLRPDWVREERR